MIERSPEIFRATIFHTPGNPFSSARAFVAIEDGALVVERGRIAACGDYSELRSHYPDARVEDWRGGFIVPGFVDTHIHYPQVRIPGGLGYTLLDWLRERTLPEEARLGDPAYASVIAKEFVSALASHGATSALVFGSHFAHATATLFEEAERSGLRIFSGLVMSDRMLLPELHQTPDAAYRGSKELIQKFHHRGKLGYAVTPRFGLSASEAMLEAAGALMREDSTLRFTTHMNENRREIEEVATLFPWASDYLAVYEKFGLAGPSSVFAHSVHSSDAELMRLAMHRASVAHCPCSNAALGSGVFSLSRHLSRRVHVALGTDVGGGIGFGLPKEALQAHLQQRVAADPVIISAPQMLYLATRAGAEALRIEEETGDFTSGKAADFVCLRPDDSPVLAGVLRRAEGPESKLAALFALGDRSLVSQVRVEGSVVFRDSR